MQVRTLLTGLWVVVGLGGCTGSIDMPSIPEQVEAGAGGHRYCANFDALGVGAALGTSVESEHFTFRKVNSAKLTIVRVLPDLAGVQINPGFSVYLKAPIELLYTLYTTPAGSAPPSVSIVTASGEIPAATFSSPSGPGVSQTIDIRNSGHDGLYVVNAVDSKQAVTKFCSGFH